MKILPITNYWYCLKQFVIYIYYYKETLEKSFEISIDKWGDTWYHTINERESTLKRNPKGT